MSQITEAVHIPARAPASKGLSPLLVLLHGYGSHEADLTALAPHFPAEFDIVSLRAPIDLGHGGYAWVQIGVPGRPSSHGVQESAEAILEWLDTHVSLQVPSITLLGFSQGGLMTSHLIRLQPERFAAAVVLAGFVIDEPMPGDSTLAKRRPPAFFGHGDADMVIPADATARASAWLPAHTNLTEKSYPGLAHSVSVQELDDVTTFLRTHVLR
ncbi:dienelactone hydrolase family protein [soil metagenome]